jgi:putative methyltransferase (TIGR04325 family)
MKTILKDIIPPILIKIFRRSIKHIAYKSYLEALNNCPKAAYEDANIVKVVIEKNVAFSSLIEKDTTFDLGALRTLIGIGLAIPSNSLKVLDFGGGGGYHFNIASTAFGNRVNFQWNVVETTAMAIEAQRLFNHNLKFFNNISDAASNLGEIDLVFTSGALHCCSDPLFFLNELLNLNAKYLFITRTSFTNSFEQVAIIQKSFLSTNGPGPLPNGFVDQAVYYPNVFVPILKVEEMITENYDIQFKIIEEKSAYIAGNNEIDMFGYFCIRRG